MLLMMLHSGLGPAGAVLIGAGLTLQKNEGSTLLSNGGLRGSAVGDCNGIGVR